MSTQKPNILFITMDQLRYDALGVTSAGLVKTPNIDRLASEGVLCEKFFVHSPMCQPSRASIITGRFPRVTGVRWNWYNLPGDPNLARMLGDAGYHTMAIGKMHFTPIEENHGFKDRVYVEGKMFSDYDEYRTMLREKDLDGRYFEHVKRWNNVDNFGAEVFPLGDENYVDSFIGARGVEMIEACPDEPFFAWFSFCNPHMPFDPPDSVAGMYDPADMEIPADFHRSQTMRWPEYRTSSGQQDFSLLTEEKLARVKAYYYATISLVDREIGRLLATLERKGVLDDTVIFFFADHGEMLGHRGVLWKGRMLYDHITHVPLIVRYPREYAGGQIVSDMLQAVDLVPTALDFCGVDGHIGLQGQSFRRLLAKEQVPWRDWAFAESLNMKMLRTHDWKLIHYGSKPYGELYNLARDPLELENLYEDPGWRGKRFELTRKLADVLIETEDQLPGPATGTAYEGLSGDHPAQEYGGRDPDTYAYGSRRGPV